MNVLFHTEPLALETIGPLVVVASLVLWVEEARKLVARRLLRRA
jgi:hypothetical protein